MERSMGVRAISVGKWLLCASGCIAVWGCNSDGSDAQAQSTPSQVAGTPQSATLTQAPSLTISGTPSSQAIAGQAYSFTPTTSDSTDSTVSFSIQNKPSWAVFSIVNGALTGTPSSSDVGTDPNIVISVTDSSRTAALAAFSILVSAAAPAPDPASPTVTLSATPATIESGSASTLSWNSSGASGCTASGGWSGSEATTGTASTGDLTATTTFTLTCSSAQGTSATQSTTVAVTPLSASGSSDLQLTTASLPVAMVGSGYSATLAASGGSGEGYVFNQVSATPDSDLWLYVTPSGTVGGTPQNAETETVVYQVTDSAGNIAQKTFALTSSTSGSLTVNSPTSLPNAINNSFYSYRILIQGGAPPYVCKSTSSQPWSVTPDCIIEGTPTSLGPVSFSSVTVTDAKANTVSYSPSVTVVAGSTTPVFSGVDSVSGYLNLPPTWAGQKYSVQLNAFGGTGSGYTYAATDLPSWATLSSSGVLSGTPTTSGNIMPTIKVTDSGGNTASVTALMNISSSVQVSRPSYNTAVSNGFFVLNGRLYDPNGYPMRVVGMDRDHFDGSSWANETNGAATGVNSIRLADSMYDSPTLNWTISTRQDYSPNGIFLIPTTFYVQPFLGVGLVSGNTLTITSVIYGSLAVGDTVTLTPLPSGTTITALGTGTGGVGTYTLSNSATVSSGYVTTATVATSGDESTTDLANVVKGWVANEPIWAPHMQEIAINIANEWGGYASPTGTVTYAQWQSSYESAVSALRAAGYTCPIVIDVLQYGEDFNIFYGGYAQNVFNSDPLKNVVFSTHLYGDTSVYAYITSITNASSAVVTVNSNSSINPFVVNYTTNPFGSGLVYFSGVQGMTQINGQVGQVIATGGSQGAWTATININTTGYGTYTGGGMIADQNSSLARARILSSYAASQGYAVIVGEFGPPTSITNAGSMDGVGRFTGYMYAYGIPTHYWAWDDGNAWPWSSSLGMSLNSGNAYSPNTPSTLSQAGMDVILNPRTGMSALDNKADSLQ